MTQDAADAEPEREAIAQETPAAPDEASGGDDEARPLPWWTVVAVAVVVLALAVVVGRLFGVGPAILVLAATALLVVVGFLFRAVQSAAEPSDDDDAIALPPTLAEVQKRAALRALKELEFEKSVGNISAEDYEVIVGRYRDEAKRAMRAVDEERKGMRERAEKIAKKAIAAEVSTEPAAAVKSLRAEPVEPVESAKGAKSADETAENLCPKCAVPNDDDARFCKGCGAVLKDVA